MTALTPRERDVLRQLAKGLTNRQIGDVLFLSMDTVKQHVSRVFKKTGIHNRVELATRAAEFLDDSRSETA